MLVGVQRKYNINSKKECKFWLEYSVDMNNVNSQEEFKC